MTESEWLQAVDSRPMLEFLWDRGSDRKWRLFLCACCRRIWHLLGDDRSQESVEAAEWYADGFGHPEDRELLNRRAYAAASKLQEERYVVGTEGVAREAVRYAAWAAVYASDLWEEDHPGMEQCQVVSEAALTCSYAAKEAVGSAADTERDPEAAEDKAQAAILRDIFGNPFRPPPTLTPSVLEWNERLVRRLAEEAYEQRIMPAGTLDPDRLAVLADALQEAGCDDADVLGHLRGPGPHWRGCRVLDLLLGKT